MSLLRSNSDLIRICVVSIDCHVRIISPTAAPRPGINSITEQQSHEGTGAVN